MSDTEVEQYAVQEAVDQVAIGTTDLLNNYKGISDDTVRVSNHYYSEYGTEYSVENPAWLADKFCKRVRNPSETKYKRRLWVSHQWNRGRGEVST